MFKKSSSLESKLPKPPNRAEILQDMENFNFELVSEIQQNENILPATVDSSSSSAVERDQQSQSSDGQSRKNLPEWWQQFETFLNDIKHLEKKQMQFNMKKSNLKKLDTTITNMATDIRSQLDEGFELARHEIEDDSINLK